MFNRLLLVCSIGSLVLGCGSDPAPAPVVAPTPQAADYYSGHWRGLARVTSSLPDAPQQMDISMTITRDNPGQCGSFEYGAIGCSGSWNCTSSFDSPSMIIQETVRFGGERCPPGAQVELRSTQDPNQIEFHYHNGGIQAMGTLSRGDM